MNALGPSSTLLFISIMKGCTGFGGLFFLVYLTAYHFSANLSTTPEIDRLWSHFPVAITVFALSLDLERENLSIVFPAHIHVVNRVIIDHSNKLFDLSFHQSISFTDLK